MPLLAANSVKIYIFSFYELEHATHKRSVYTQSWWLVIAQRNIMYYCTVNYIYRIPASATEFIANMFSCGLLQTNGMTPLGRPTSSSGIPLICTSDIVSIFQCTHKINDRIKSVHHSPTTKSMDRTNGSSRNIKRWRLAQSATKSSETNETNTSISLKQHKSEDSDRASKLEEKEICLADWWIKYQELSEHPHLSLNELEKLPKSAIYEYLYKAEIFRETFGDSAVHLHERVKRRKYEVIAGVEHHVYTEIYDRKRVHHPAKAKRYNKRRRIEEYYEDYSDTWICKHDEKPCGCAKCMPCFVCGQVRCTRKTCVAVKNSLDV